MRGVTEGSAFRVYRARALKCHGQFCMAGAPRRSDDPRRRGRSTYLTGVETVLSEAGARVLTAGNQKSGLAAANDRRLTVAVLDVRLSGESVEPICACLDGHWVPFLFLTGDSGSDVQKWAPAPVVAQPFDTQALIDVVVRALVTGRDALDLADKTRIDLIIFRAQIRLARQERLADDLARREQDTQAATGLLRIMRESVELLQAHRRTFQDNEVLQH